jgi:hypothetical protein
LVQFSEASSVALSRDRNDAATHRRPRHFVLGYCELHPQKQAHFKVGAFEPAVLNVFREGLHPADIATGPTNIDPCIAASETG